MPASCTTSTRKAFTFQNRQRLSFIYFFISMAGVKSFYILLSCTRRHKITVLSKLQANQLITRSKQSHKSLYFVSRRHSSFINYKHPWELVSQFLHNTYFLVNTTPPMSNYLTWTPQKNHCLELTFESTPAYHAFTRSPKELLPTQQTSPMLYILAPSVKFPIRWHQSPFQDLATGLLENRM